MTTLIGLLAAFLTSLAFLPQVVKTIRTRATADLSLGMYAVFTTGVALWLLYGLLVADKPIIVANAFTLVLSATVLTMKLRHG
ncbi:MAG TPA: SemiSWEET transporter [Gammaproteobacteria bacterium]|nr:SemiSWEET transporter [Gammaproteobacteria bacterium]